MKKCDECGLKVGRENRISWLRVERRGATSLSNISGWRFCSWSCIAKWVAPR